MMQGGSWESVEEWRCFHFLFFFSFFLAMCSLEAEVLFVCRTCAMRYKNTRRTSCPPNLMLPSAVATIKYLFYWTPIAMEPREPPVSKYIYFHPRRRKGNVTVMGDFYSTKIQRKVPLPQWLPIKYLVSHNIVKSALSIPPGLLNLIYFASEETAWVGSFHIACSQCEGGEETGGKRMPRHG